MPLNNSQKAQEFYKHCKHLIKNKLAEGTLVFSAEGKVVRSEIYQAINSSRGVMNQNPRVKRLLRATERWAKMRGILINSAPERSKDFRQITGSSDPQITQMQVRISYLEKQVAALTIENQELRKVVKRSDWIDKFLTDSENRIGALPW